MVSPIVAAAAPAVISNATDDEGVLNKLFKIAMLIGILALGAISLIIISFLIDIADIVGASYNVISLGLRFVLPGNLGGGLLAAGAAYFFNAFGFGSRS